MVWEQENRNSKGQLEITGGNKGIITFDLSVESADVDIHSKFGAVIESASWYLLNAISSMRDDHGRILIDGIYGKLSSQMNVKWILSRLTPLKMQIASVRFMA